MPERVCDECGLSLDSAEHMRGVGLHGHVRTSKHEADKQRAAGIAQTEAEEAARLAAESAAQTEAPKGTKGKE